MGLVHFDVKSGKTTTDEPSVNSAKVKFEDLFEAECNNAILDTSPEKLAFETGFKLTLKLDKGNKLKLAGFPTKDLKVVSHEDGVVVVEGIIQTKEGGTSRQTLESKQSKSIDVDKFDHVDITLPSVSFKKGNNAVKDGVISFK
ncbi:MAG: hypothetical protein ABIF12_03940 [bacterium]